MSKPHRRLVMHERYNRSVDLLTHLRTFCAVADQRSFTRAAEELGVPQPVVSRRMAALERHLGGRLLVRDPRGVVPSDLGRTVLPHARDLQVRADHLLEVARAVGSGLVVWLPEGARARDLVGARTAAAAVGLEVTFAVADPEARRTALQGAVAALAVLPCAPDEAELATGLGAGVRTGTDRRLHLDALRHRRGDDGRPRRLHLGPEDDHPWVRDVVRRHAARAGLSPQQVVEASPSLTAVADVLEHDDLWLCTPAQARSHGLAWLEVADLGVTRGYRVVAGRAGAAVTTSAQRSALAADLGPALGVDPTDRQGRP